jgi:hypothetical protein
MAASDDDDIAALIGGHGSQLQPEPRRTETPQDEIDAILKQVAGGKGSFVDAGDLKRPVTRNFLAQVFDMDPATVKKRLLKVKPLGTVGAGVQHRELYDFKEAVGYLVEPKIDLDAYIKSLDPAKLPNHINKFFWEAQRTKLKFMLEARHAWLTEDVLEVFGTVFMLIKDRVQLWPETAQESLRLVDEQVARLKQLADDLQKDLHEQLVALPAQRQTLSYAATFDEGTAEAGEVAE